MVGRPMGAMPRGDSRNEPGAAPLAEGEPTEV